MHVIITQYRSKVWSKGHHETKSCTWADYVHFCLYSKIKENESKKEDIFTIGGF